LLSRGCRAAAAGGGLLTDAGGKLILLPRTVAIWHPTAGASMGTSGNIADAARRG